MYTKEIRLPQLPATYYRPSTLGSLALIAYAFVLFVLPAGLARALLSTSLPLPLIVVLEIPLIWLAAQGVLLIAWIGHEGAAHFSLFRNKLASLLVGMFVASTIPSYMELGFAVSHRNHHRFTNQASDPDCQVFGHFKHLWAKLLRARLHADLVYTKNILLMAFNQPVPYKYVYPYRGGALTALAWINIAFATLWIGLYIVIARIDPPTVIVSVALPVTLMILISSLQPYLEHAGTKVGLGCDARSRTAPLLTLLYAGNNYHLEHHLYPSVPCYRLPAVHQLLQEKGFYRQVDANIEPTISGVYRIGATMPYPAPGLVDKGYDPLLVAGPH
jgi:beta-carotene hydroxylase